MEIEKFVQLIPIDQTQKNFKSQSKKFQVGHDVYVYYDDYLDGGGTSIGQNYPGVLELFYPNRVFDNCLEWCAGPGFIGFRLLADGICNNLILLECFRPAVDACNKTISQLPKRFKNKVSVIHSNNIKSLSEEFKFDLIVANPPHFNATLWSGIFHDTTAEPGSWCESDHFNTKATDKNWQLHQEFFINIKKNLAANGIVLLQECIFGSSVDEFKDFIHAGGLKITNAFREKKEPNIWYLELQHK